MCSDLVEVHVGVPVEASKAFDVSIVLRTVSVSANLSGATLSAILSELDGTEPSGRTSMNAFQNKAFSEAVKATARNRLIVELPSKSHD